MGKREIRNWKRGNRNETGNGRHWVPTTVPGNFGEYSNQSQMHLADYKVGDFPQDRANSPKLKTSPKFLAMYAYGKLDIHVSS